jgi:hypothetical protein
MYTADLKGEDLPSDATGWLEEVRNGAATARYVADEFDKAAERLTQTLIRSETSDLPLNLAVADLGKTVLNQIADGDR